MGFIKRYLGLEDEQRAVTFQDFWGAGLDGPGEGTAAGKRVTVDSALQVSAVYGCVRILSDSIATLPLDAFKRVGGARRPFRPKPSWMLFQQGPWTRVDILTQIMVSLLLDGNAYVATHRDREGRIIFMEVIDPDKVTPELDGSEPVFFVSKDDGSRPRLTRFDILHVRGMSLPGAVEGLSPVSYARETIGLALAATEYGATFFGNGALPGMALEIPGPISAPGIRQLQRAWNDAHQGSGNAHKLAIVTEGAKFAKTTIDPEDAQFLQTRQFQVVDIARIFGVPAHMLQHADVPQIGTSMAEQNVAFVQHSLRPWVERIEAVLTWALLSEGLPPEVFAKLNMDGLQRGDYESRYTTYVMAVREGILTINEARAYEDMPPVPWGDDPISVQVQEDDTPATGTPDPEDEGAIR